MSPPVAPDFRPADPSAKQKFSEVTDRVFEQGQEFVQSKPVGILIAAVALGVVAAMLMRKPEPTLRERAVDGPLDEVRHLLGNLRAELGGKTEKRFDRSLSAIEGALHKAKRALS